MSIQSYDVLITTEMLGLNWAPIGDSSSHVEVLVKKGKEWVDILTTRPLSRRDAWMSYELQLLPHMTWGLVAVVLAPAILNA